MAAFTRLAHQPILERGAILQPDLVVVADDTLLADPAAQPLAGCARACPVLLNSTQEAGAIQHSTGHSGRFLVSDFTTLVLDSTHTLASLSTALGVAAAHLAGLDYEHCLAGLEAELEETHLSAEQRLSNRQLAEAVYARVHDWTPVQEGADTLTVPEIPLAEVTFEPPWRAAPSIYAIANSPERRTGNWRQFRPVLDPALCTRCWVCFVRCPEGAITLDAHDYPVVDYDVCKGCLLCVHECPTHAFSAAKEVR
jgi:pyruvate ferredoxin oxidoreductase gamma subunit